MANLIFHPGLMHAWLLSMPLVLGMAYVVATKKEVARRMSDMTGYTSRERYGSEFERYMIAVPRYLFF